MPFDQASERCSVACPRAFDQIRIGVCHARVRPLYSARDAGPGYPGMFRLRCGGAAFRDAPAVGREPMKRILVTGMSGTGKSTVINRLATLGYRAVDSDYGGYPSP